MAAAAANAHATYALRDGSLADLDRCLDVMAAPPDGVVPAALASVNRCAVVARHLLTGNTTDAEQVAAEALSLGMSAIPEQAVLTYGIHHRRSPLATGAGGRVHRHLRFGVAADVPHPMAAAARAAMYAEAGRLDDALGLLIEGSASRVLEPADRLRLADRPRVLRVRGDRLCGGRGPASILVEKLAPYEHLMSASHNTCEGPVALWLGGLATVVGAFSDAERWFSAALEMSRRCESRYFTARTLLEWSTMLDRAGGLGTAG